MRRQIGVQRGDDLGAFTDRGAGALDRIEPHEAIAQCDGQMSLRYTTKPECCATWS